MARSGIRIDGSGMKDDDGDLLWVTIETRQVEMRIEFPAAKAEEIKVAFCKAVDTGISDADRDGVLNTSSIIEA